MHIIKFLVMVLVMLSLSFSENITISGKVTDTNGTPISGAEVVLKAGGQKTTSGVDGSFILTGKTTGITAKPVLSQLHQPIVTITNGLLRINLQEPSAITILTYNLQGCSIASMNKSLGAGDNTIELSRNGTGIYFYKVHINNNEFIIMSHSLRSCAGTVNAAQGSLSYSLTKLAQSTVFFHDTITVKKDGYSNCLAPLYKADTSGIKIKMRWILVIKDMDGNSYKTVKIGNQVWTSENWRSTKYKDGTSIPLIADANIWKNLITPGYCWYNNGTSNAYGALYNWYAVSTGKLAPAGWHVPSAAEWDTLQNYLTAHGYNWDSSVMINKVAQSMAAQQDWPVSLIAGCIGYNLSKNNRSGFSALPGGYRMGSTFDSFGIFGYWWTSTQTGTSSTASCRGLHYNADYLGNANHALTDGYSVRLVKD